MRSEDEAISSLGSGPNASAAASDDVIDVDEADVDEADEEEEAATKKRDKLGSTTPSWLSCLRPSCFSGRASDMAPSATRARTPAIRGTPGAVGGGCRHSSCAG